MKRGVFAGLGALALGLLAGAAAVQPQAGAVDLVLAGGRVMDPESGLDALRYVGIQGAKIAAVSEQPLRGRNVVDVSGKVVAPGFIDLHAHGQGEENNRLQARDGVTTALELEVGVSPVGSWYAERQGHSLIHYGAAVGHIPVRMAVVGDSGTFLPRDEAIRRKLSDSEQRELLEALERGLEEGALGVGMGIAYVPQASREEILNVFQLAARRGVTCFVHVRSAGRLEPGSSIEALQEVIANAAGTGASLHIVHIGSSGLGQTGACLRLIEGAARRGLDVTTEVYPYTAAMTALDSAIFEPGWQERLGISYSDLQWVATGERLTAESFARYREKGGSVIIHLIPEEVVRLALGHPSVLIASDGSISGGKGHPRGAGTFSRVLGRYVREQKLLSLMEALGKMTLLPARRLEAGSPQMRSKGRVQVGADADLTVFDPERVIDRATYEAPAEPSEGIVHVLVNGVFIVRDSILVEGVRPGVAVRGAAKRH
jgi:N-acyl-D-aspartate/D-glutamate deacylase